jgi:hypothetical protein
MRQRHISFTAAEAPYLSREASEGEGREGRSKGGRKGGRKERQLMDAWSWIGKCDELSRAMETGDLLFGFHEVAETERERWGGRKEGRVQEGCMAVKRCVVARQSGARSTREEGSGRGKAKPSIWPY